jgi:hypothetical protein
MRRGLVVAFVTALISASVAAASSVSWTGRWQRAAGEYGAGSAVFTLVQHGKHVTGLYHWKGCSNVFGGTVSGTATGRLLTAVFNHRGDAHGTLVLHLSANGRSITGSFKVTGGTCAGTTGAFHATRVPG